MLPDEYKASIEMMLEIVEELIRYSDDYNKLIKLKIINQMLEDLK